MASDGKPRRSKKSGNRRKNKQAAKDTKSQISNTIFDSLLENVSLTSAAGLGVAVVALTASAVLLRSPKVEFNEKLVYCMIEFSRNFSHTRLIQIPLLL